MGWSVVSRMDELCARAHMHPPPPLFESTPQNCLFRNPVSTLIADITNLLSRPTQLHREEHSSRLRQFLTRGFRGSSINKKKNMVKKGEQQQQQKRRYTVGRVHRTGFGESPNRLTDQEFEKSQEVR
ncbi:PREDICTED: uncharacterized protein LOC108559493 [Nicrophorus vespilloides]|uniref:Uncharacterized protein LOC108559493 n=1 Tax=Nicrophorus vespilloides TaxID=110193 RepID=A0ABM1MCI2_NICVS|nr:PREDICTED: uncharacterized protein LOC108559493 [Nicrophorus vespilloides]